ncbi:MAG: trimeric intracellular cation channel family protein [Nitrosopumilaceae archaeon]|uniref:Trimeric intracellular cation channel family protein n=4 Tax=Candidatus Nitrosomaritimum aestuariumsis TaxID=3342354 RepID=A0AC60WBD8_9ARCH|nr:trimeric intracellular cation channel family protein [Nitrosopumilaceae archaeon]MBA4460804.1 trimeric intracellular cation channel family protein [Nitrosopumilaceae archaeon]MBA4462155.1 trimeric intracellular cation channel family protein [Nitrosopumilaceae archaeon]MBA4464225.1 trimeric intracellular cation channel family protein [Nitrosopumilaceae archaeon]NCF21766.1 trimeric intracellular cation channel family protein [Nitrosopumilaceae archaeon]
MVDFSIPSEVFIYILDLFGTMAFAVTGAFKAIEHKSDFVGIILLATITGVAGGTIRDVVMGKFPNSISDPTYVIITVASGVCIFFLYSKLKKHWNLFLKFDAFGLGIFTIIGGTFAYNLFGLNFLAIVFAGVLTAVGGGILRDVFVNQVPIVFVKELYVTASFVGIFVFYFLLYTGAELYVATIVGIVIATGTRLTAMKFNWHLPKVKGNLD